MNATLAAGFFSGLLALAPCPAKADAWTAAGLTFSDEFGGFRLISVSGWGSIADPIVIVEEITDLGPATMVIRGAQVRRDKTSAEIKTTFTNLAVVKVVTNLTERVWIGFELELQEEYRHPSPYDDGLSFDQMNVFSENSVQSDSFSHSRRISEPYDRVRFRDGSVSPGETVRFRFNITDPTPDPEFFLLQEPHLLVAAIPPASRHLAAALER